MNQPPTQQAAQTNWKSQISKDHRNQIFQVVVSNMRRQPAFNTFTDQEISRYTLEKMTQYWKEATSKEQFLELVAKLADPRHNSPPVQARLPIQPQPVPYTSNPLSANISPQTTVTQPTIQQSPNLLVPNAEEVQKYWARIAQLKSFVHYVHQYLDSFHKKRSDLQKNKMASLSTLSEEQISKIDKNLSKYDTLIGQFQKVYDVMTGKIAPQSYNPTGHDIYMLQSIEMQIKKQIETQKAQKISTSEATVAPTIAASPIQSSPSPEPPVQQTPLQQPIQQQAQHITQISPKDPTQRLIGVLNGMEREFPRDLRLALSRIQEKIDIVTEESEYFDQVRKIDDQNDDETFLDMDGMEMINRNLNEGNTMKHKSKVAHFLSQPIKTQMDHDMRKNKRQKIRENGVNGFECLVNLNKLERTLIDNINTGFFTVSGIAVQSILYLSPNRHDRHGFFVNCKIITRLCYIPLLTITIRLSDDEESDDILNMIPTKIDFESSDADDMNQVFIKARSMFEQSIQDKKSRGSMNIAGVGAVRVPFVIQSWIRSVHDVMQNELKQDYGIENGMDNE